MQPAGTCSAASKGGERATPCPELADPGVPGLPQGSSGEEPPALGITTSASHTPGAGTSLTCWPVVSSLRKEMDSSSLPRLVRALKQLSRLSNRSSRNSMDFLALSCTWRA